MKKLFRQTLSGWGGILLSCVVSGLPADAQAGVVSHLYEISLPVVDQGDVERQKALRQGLENIVIRMSGQAEVRQNPAISAALAHPDSYLQQFAYVSLTDAEKAEFKTLTEQKNRQGTSGVNRLRPELPPTIRINLSFSPEPVKALLRTAQLPIWPVTRPSVLAWVMVDGGASGKRLLARTDAAYGFLSREAGRRGLQVVLPMNDLKDQVVSGGAGRLWDMDKAVITELSQRYGEDSILVGRITQGPGVGDWQGSWLYTLGELSWQFEGQADDMDGVLGRGLGEVVAIQVQRYGVRPGSESNSITLEVSGVDGLQHYANVLAFLKSLDLIKTVQVTGVKDDILYCALVIDGDSRTLRELIALEHVLVSSDEVMAGDIVAPSTLRFKFSSK